MANVILEHVEKIYNENAVVEDFTVTVKDGEFLSFLGPSGCGKTTSLRMIAGFIEPTKGIIQIGDKMVSHPRKNIMIPPENRNIGMVFQSYAVWPHMDVYKNVSYPLKLKKFSKSDIRKKVEKVLKMVHLQGMASRYPHQLSGGQQQRVALARALVMEPRVLLLDEPLSNLDAKLREAMRFELKDLQDRTEATVIYVTHDQAEAMAMSDRIVVMNNGKIHQIGTPSEIYNSPSNSFVAGFIGLTNFITCNIVDENEIEIDAGTKQYRTKAIIPPEIEKDKVLISVRPEDISIVTSGGNFSGVIKRVTYLGDSIDYRVEVGEILFRVITSPKIQLREEDEVQLKIGDVSVFELNDD